MFQKRFVRREVCAQHLHALLQYVCVYILPVNHQSRRHQAPASDVQAKQYALLSVCPCVCGERGRERQRKKKKAGMGKWGKDHCVALSEN